jgi:hypothetical protein
VVSHTKGTSAEDRALRIIFGPEREKVEGDWR